MEPVRVITITDQTTNLSYVALCQWSIGLVGVHQQSGHGKMPEMPERIIHIPGQRCTVEVRRMGKTIWIVVGEYWGEQIRTRGTTERKALKAWRTAVSHKYQQTETRQFDLHGKGQVMVLPGPNNLAAYGGRILRGR
jgi:hypothetical protein